MRVYVAAALLLMGALAGCSDKEDDDGDHADHADHGVDAGADPAAAAVLHLGITIGGQTHNFSSAAASGHAGHSAPASSSATSTSSNATGNATGNATTPSGLAPLNVTFRLSATGLRGAKALAWSFDFGRAGGASGNASGNATASGAANGTTLPATLDHTYTAVGDYNVTYVLRVANGTAQSLRATLHVGNGNVSVTPALPAVTHFEYGESLGCTGDLAGNTCIEWQNGPPGSDVDGHWIALDASYWGLGVTSTVDQGAIADSDCVFTDADLAVLGQGNNGGEACLGTVPEGSAWMFIYPYGLPALAMTVDFAPAA